MQTQIDLEPFLDWHQRKALQLEIQAIKDHLHLPATITVLQNAVHNSPLLIEFIQIDPKGTILTKKLKQINNKAILELFGQCVQFLSLKMVNSIDLFIQERNINYVLSEFEQFIKSKCQYVGFAWQADNLHSGSLWTRLMISIRNLLTITLEFICTRYQMKDIRVKQKVQDTMISFEKQLKPLRNKLEHMHVLEDELRQSLIKYKKKESQEMDMYKSVTSEAINQLEQLQKIQEEKQNQQKTTHFKEKEKSLFNLSQRSTKSQSNILSQQRTIPYKKQTQNDLKNLQIALQLNEAEEKTVNDIMYLDAKTLLSLIEGCFTSQQISILQFTINKPLIDWQADDMFITGMGRLVDSNYIKLCGYKQNLSRNLKLIKTGQKMNENRFLIIALLLYRALQYDYNPFTKKYLGKVLESIELTFTYQNCNYLRGALRQYETVHLKPSEFAVQLQTQPPYRSSTFQETIKSKLRRECDYMGYAKQIMDQFNKEELLKFQRLNYAKPTKNVTFLISGFLSQDTEKDLEWLGVIRAIEDTELYGVVWRSGTKLDLIGYVGTVVGSLAMQGLQAQGGNLFAVAQVAQMGFKLVNYFKKKQDQKKNNPFWASLVKANQTGIELANKLIQSFSDRNITLIGFSMGTEVIVSCLNRLIEMKQEKIIFKIVTMGGVADRENVHKIIERSNQPLTWINFQSKKDYAVKYVYRVCTLGSKPIGSDGIPQVYGHEVLNWEVGSVVSGHMDFRPNLHGLCLIAGLKND